jgi:ankyrin repeat protein
LLASHAALGGEFLNAAAIGGQVAVIEALLDGGIDINTRNHRGSTPLMGAAKMSKLNAVDLLLTRGADPTLRADGRTAAKLAPIFRVRKRLKEAIANWEA